MLREKSSTGTVLIGDNRKFCAQNGKYLVKGGSIHLEIFKKAEDSPKGTEELGLFIFQNL